jgi:hypothetical protein
VSEQQNTPEEPQEATPAAPKPYSESPDHVPDPTAVTGTLETSGTGGGRHARLEGVAAIFEGVTQQTVELDGLAVHQGAVVQNDTTGVPETFTSPTEEQAPAEPVAEESEPEGEVSPEVVEEVVAEAAAEGAPVETETKAAPAKKTAARKTAATDPKK